MTEFVCSLAGVPVAVQALCEETKAFCREYLTDEEPALTLRMTREDIEAEQRHAEENARREGQPPRKWPESYLEQLALYRKLAEAFLERDIMLFHGSAIALDGEVYLFTAKSGTGKSTHARLWRRAFGERAYMVNDDKPLLRFSESGVEVCGTPWDGKHRLSRNVILPLRAVGVITRAAENRVEELPLWEAYSLLLQQSYRPAAQDGTQKLLALLGRLCTQVPVRRVCCNMEQEAALVSYEGLRREKA